MDIKKIDQHIHDTVKQVEQEAAKSSYSMRLDDLGIPDVSPEQQAAFEKAMEEYDDHPRGDDYELSEGCDIGLRPF